MKKIANVQELKQGDKIVHFAGVKIEYFEFLMIHPHNDKYALLLDVTSQDAIKHYIPNITDTETWQIDYKREEVYAHLVELHKRRIKDIQKRFGFTD